MIKIGFTGTRNGMTPRQMCWLSIWLHSQFVNNDSHHLQLSHAEFHHGDCKGADAQATEIARSIGYKIHVHPPSNPAGRAFTFIEGDKAYPPKEYLYRNHDIVNATTKLFACPKEPIEVLRSGTWATIRYGRKVLGRDNVVVISPKDE